jgi:DNA-binding response OmpR family regulator
VFLKRAENTATVSDKIVVADMEIDMENKTVSRNGKNINLTAKEFALLVLLSRNKGK